MLSGIKQKINSHRNRACAVNKSGPCLQGLQEVGYRKIQTRINRKQTDGSDSWVNKRTGLRLISQTPFHLTLFFLHAKEVCRNLSSEMLNN